MTEWTDRDYAQAAIDMLPETVEEIDELMRVHGIKNKKAQWRSTTCPVAQWVRKWTGGRDSVNFDYATGEWGSVYIPYAVREYIFHADKQIKPL